MLKNIFYILIKYFINLFDIKICESLSIYYVCVCLQSQAKLYRNEPERIVNVNVGN